MKERWYLYGNDADLALRLLRHDLETFDARVAELDAEIAQIARSDETAQRLQSIPGIGPARKRALLLHFGTASKVRAASLEDLQRAPGVSAGVAQQVYDFYHAGG